MAATVSRPIPRSRVVGVSEGQLVQLGQGFNSVAYTTRDRGIKKSHERVEPTFSRTAQNVTYHCEAVQNVADLKRSLRLSGSGGLSWLFGHVDLNAEFIAESQVNSYSQFYVLRVHVVNSSESLHSYRLRHAARQILRRKRERVEALRTFFTHYGDEFISSITTGGELIVLFEIQAKTERRRREIEAELSGSKCAWTAAADFKRVTGKLSELSEKRIRVRRRGGAGLPLPDESTILEAGLQFPQQVHPVSGNPAIISFTTMDYAACELPAGWSLPDFSSSAKMCERLAEDYDAALHALNDLAYIESRPHEFPEVTPALVQPLRTQLQAIRDAVEAKVQQLSADPFARVEIDYGAIPSAPARPIAALPVTLAAPIAPSETPRHHTSASKLQEMDQKADQVIRNWSMGATLANVLPPPFDAMAVAGVFAKMGGRLGEVYETSVSWSVLKALGASMATGVSSVAGAGYVGLGLFKWIPAVNAIVATWIQPPIVGAVGYAVGKSFKRYFHARILEGRELTTDEIRQLAEAGLRDELKK